MHTCTATYTCLTQMASALSGTHTCRPRKSTLKKPHRHWHCPIHAHPVLQYLKAWLRVQHRAHCQCGREPGTKNRRCSRGCTPNLTHQQPDAHSTATTRHTTAQEGPLLSAGCARERMPASGHTQGMSNRYNRTCASKASRAVTGSQATCAGVAPQHHHSTQALHHCLVTHCH